MLGRALTGWLALLATVVGCSDAGNAESDSDAATGGQLGSGSTAGAGGMPVGGAPSSGGAPLGGFPGSMAGGATAGGAPSGAAGGTLNAGGILNVGGGGMSAGGALSTGGSLNAGGAPGTGGAAAGGSSGSTGGSDGTGGSNGTCVTGQVQPSEVLFIGDSFIALNNSIPTELEANARAAALLGQNEHYRNNAVSGTTLAGNQIPSQYQNAVTASPVKVVLMDGGGNDCLQRNDGDAAYDAAVPLFESMAQNDTEYVVYFFYPDPLKGLANSSLQSCLDALRPRMQELCEGLTAPQCFFVDLRPGWADADVINDGIHPTPQGGKKVADQVWAVMQQECIAQ